MRTHPNEIPSWTRRDFVRAGLVTASVATLGACARPGTWPAAAAADAASDLDNLARRVRGRLLRGSSPGYNEARKVWNLAYDLRPLPEADLVHQGVGGDMIGQPEFVLTPDALGL